MSVIIIGTGGGGHHAVKYLAENYSVMTPDDKEKAVYLLRHFVANVNEQFGQHFDTNNL